MTTLTKSERETIIRYYDDEDIAYVYTCSPSTMKKVDRMTQKVPTCIMEKEDKWSKWYRMPKACVPFRMLTSHNDKTRAEMAARAKRLSKQKKDPKKLGGET